MYTGRESLAQGQKTMNVIHQTQQLIGTMLHVQLPVEFANCTVEVTVQRCDTPAQNQLNFIDFMRQSPLIGLELDVVRSQSITREIDL